MRLKTLLEKMITKINANSSDISSDREIIFDNYYSNSRTFANVKSTTLKGVTLTLPKKGIYLILVYNTVSVGSAGTTISAGLSDSSTYGASNVTTLMSAVGVSIMNAGGGVCGWGLVEAKTDNAVMGSYTYGYYTSSCNFTMKMLALRIPTLNSAGGGLSNLKKLFSFNKRVRWSFA